MFKMRKELLEKNLKLYSDKIERKKNFTHVKYGDGEIICMARRGGKNCDQHDLSIELGNKLLESLVYLSQNPDVYFPDWYFSNPPINVNDDINLSFFNSLKNNYKLILNSIQPFELIMMGWGNMEYDFLFKFLQKIKKSERKKIYVGPERLRGINDVLSIDKYIEIPLINAFNNFEEILRDILIEVEEDSIILFSVGPMSPYLIYKILKTKPNVTLLDIGSGFDSLFVGQTRGENQATTEIAKKYIENL
jgi:hypothetical protein